MAKTNNLTDFLKGVADAIRTKKGTSALINPQDFETEIANISAQPKLQGEVIITPSSSKQTVTPDTSYDGLSEVTVNATPTSTKTVTPTKSSQTVQPTSGTFLSSVTVNPIPSDYITTTDATATAASILSGKTAYVNGSKVTGTIGIYDGTVEALSGASTNAMPLRIVEPPIAVETATNGTNTNTVIEIATADEMSALLTEDNVGKMYKYVGESNGTFENGEIYVVEA